MRAVNRFNVTNFWNPNVLRIPNWYGTCLGQKIFTIGLPAECDRHHHANFQASCLPLIYPGLLVLGLSCGLSNPLSAIYITEIAGMANKGIVTSMFNFNLTFGILLTNVVGSLAG